MLQLRTRLKPADNCGAKSLEIMHIYIGSKHKQAGIGDTVLAVVKEAMPNGLVKKKEKVKAVIVRTKKNWVAPMVLIFVFQIMPALLLILKKIPEAPVSLVQ